MGENYEPPKNPDIYNMDSKELKKFREYLIEKIEVHLPMLIDDIDSYIQKNEEMSSDEKF